jgi:hypothetical protein
MPLGEESLVTVRHGIGQIMLDVYIAQAIVNVEVERGATAARFRFETAWPSFATVEIFRMVHGELSLDMEKENLVRTEIELFGDARSLHDVLVGGLEQEHRFWYRISVPRRSPPEPAATGKVRARGEFATKRRDTIGDIETIHILDDSDTSGAGELKFAAAVYDATVAQGPRLGPPQVSGERDIDSGGDFDAPFDNLVTIGRAPDRIGILVIGHDDDVDAEDFLTFQGFAGIGLLPPDRMPARAGTFSNSAVDDSDALAFVDLPNFVERSVQPFSFKSARGALWYSCSGHIIINLLDTLGQRPVPPWKALRRTKMKLARDGRAAGVVGLRTGRVALAIAAEGGLARQVSGGGGRWQELAGPPLDQLLVQMLSDGSQLLAGLDEGGQLHLARLADLRSETPRWRGLELVAGALPVTVEGRQGEVHLLASDPHGGLWHARLDAAGARARAPERLAERADGRAVAAVDDDGRLLVALSDGEGILHLATLHRDGKTPAVERLDGDFTTPLAIVADPRAGLLLAALDGAGRVAVRGLRDRAAGWQLMGPLDEVLEGPIDPVVLTPPDACEPPATAA